MMMMMTPLLLPLQEGLMQHFVMMKMKLAMLKALLMVKLMRMMRMMMAVVVVLMMTMMMRMMEAPVSSSSWLPVLPSL